MAVDLKIKSNSKQVSKKFQKFQSVLPRIIDKGINFKDGAFAPYSQGYINKLNREGKSTNVDLFYSGRMLSALTPSGKTIRKTGTNKVSVNFSNSQMRQRAIFNQVLGKTKREFFGFDDRTANIIRKQFNRFVAKEFRKARI